MDGGCNLYPLIFIKLNQIQENYRKNGEIWGNARKIGIYNEEEFVCKVFLEEMSCALKSNKNKNSY